MLASKRLDALPESICPECSVRNVPVLDAESREIIVNVIMKRNNDAARQNTAFHV